MLRQTDPDLIADTLFRGIFESDIAGFVVGDLNSGMILAVNDRLVEITGHSREAICSETEYWRTMTPPEYHHLDERAVVQVLERGSAEPFEKEYLRPDGSRVPVRVACAAVPDRPGRLIVQIEDISEQVAAKRRLAKREVELAAAVRAGNLAVFEYDHVTGELRSSPRFSELYGFPPEHRLTIDDIRAAYHPDDAERIKAQVIADDADPSVRHFDWTLHLRLHDGSERWVQGLGEYDRAADGSIVTSRGVAMDISERVRSDLHQRLLIAELNHRVKNTLAVIQSIARQTFAEGRSRAEALAAFEGRLTALAAAHKILTEQSWETAELRDLLSSALESHLSDPGRSTLEGPEVRIPPRFAVSLAMAIHELATNAAKYGALRNESGRIHLSWSAKAGRLEIVWRELGGPAVAAPARRGFGTKMIERALASDLGGSAVLAFEPEGLTCRIDAPLPAQLN